MFHVKTHLFFSIVLVAFSVMLTSQKADALPYTKVCGNLTEMMFSDSGAKYVVHAMPQPGNHYYFEIVLADPNGEEFLKANKYLCFSGQSFHSYSGKNTAGELSHFIVLHNAIIIDTPHAHGTDPCLVGLGF